MIEKIACVLATSLLVACGGSGSSGTGASVSPSVTASSPSTPAFVTATCSPSGEIELEAEDNKFSTECIAVKAGTSFAVKFKNRDNGTSHNMVISQDVESTHIVHKTKTSIGIEDTVFQIPALQKARYFYLCEFHPGLMQGTLIAS